MALLNWHWPGRTNSVALLITTAAFFHILMVSTSTLGDSCETLENPDINVQLCYVVEEVLSKIDSFLLQRALAIFEF